MKPVFGRFEPVNYLWNNLVLTKHKNGAQKVDLSHSYSIEESLAHFSFDLNFIERLEVLNSLSKSQKIDFDAYFKFLGQYFDPNLHGKIFRVFILLASKFY